MPISSLTSWFRPYWGMLADAGRNWWFFLVAALAPLAILHSWLSLSRPRYDFTPLALIGAAVLVRREWQSAPPGGPLWRWLSVTIAVGSLIAAAGAFLLHSPWLIAIAFAGCATSVIRESLGSGWLRRAWVPLAMIAFTVPLPFGMDENIALQLRKITSRLGSGVLDLMQVEHLLRGNVFEVPGKQLFVDEACSGVNSVFSVVVCCLFYLGLVGRGLIRSSVLLALSLLWVVVANVLRVVAVVTSAAWGGPDLATGTPHDLLGAAVFLVAILLLVSSDQFLLGLLPTYGPPGGVEGGVDPRLYANRRSTTPGTTVFGLAIGALAVLFALFYVVPMGAQKQRSQLVDRFNSLNENAMPKSIGEWERDKFETPTRDSNHEFGEFSRTWTYRRGIMTATVSVDYPFFGWHNLDRCYQAMGWSREDKQNVDNEGERRVEIHYKRSAAEFGFLIYGMLTPGGPMSEPEDDRIADSLMAKLTNIRRLMGGSGGGSSRKQSFVVQLQVFIESSDRLNQEQELEARKLFRELEAMALRVLGGNTTGNQQ